ncbi:MAG: Flp pilus assembly complex ATPase component TadA [Planctomycetes bacterium]|nr:Flp pilus assembly complex ATPase component TadA [Planctomycetota bacterium]
MKVIDKKHNRSKEVEISEPEFTIGKRAGSDLVLDRFNVSRKHCRIIQSNGGFVLEDCNSTNGTFTEAGKTAGQVPLRDGSQIFIGDFVLVFSADADPQEAPPEQADDPQPDHSAPAVRRTAQPARQDSQRVTPVELKRKIHDNLLNDLDLRHIDISDKSHEELHNKALEVVRTIVDRMADEVPQWLRSEDLVKEVVDEAVGLGPLEMFLADRSVDEIMVNNWNKIYVERNGKIEKTNQRFTDNKQLLAIIRRILAPIGRRIDESSPMVDARLADGSRVNAITPPLSLTGPTLTIRKFAYEPFTADDLVSFATLSQRMSDFLKLCVANRRNIVVSGGTGSGKTTFLNVVSSFIDPDERIVTIEDSAELKLPQEHVISLESKPPNIEGFGEISIRKLVINTLRMRPNRIIVGECRGGEALDMLQAMNTGHDGSLTTLHANSPRDALARLETLVLMAGLDLPARAIRDQVAAAINLIVHTARLTDGKRKVTAITEVTGMEGDVITLQDIYVFKQTGVSADGAILGHFEATGAVPTFVHGLKKRGIHVDMQLFA